jgi:hypothetical protein
VIKSYLKRAGREFAELGFLDFSCLKWANLCKKISLGSRRLYRPYLPSPSISDKQLLGLIQKKFSSTQQLAAYLKQRDEPKFFLDQRDQNSYVDTIRQHYPAAMQATIAQADQICAHVFDLLGYRQLQLSSKINWNSDPRFGGYWYGYYLKLNYMNPDDDSDIRIAWELSRCQHFITLGRAYWYTRDEKYAKEFVDQLQDWLEANPPQWGINWLCTMEVALRSISWIRAYYFFLDSPSFTPDIQIKLIKSLIQHARHILSNLEGNPYGRFGNHYVSNGLGLFCLGLFFRDFKMGAKWLAEGLRILWRETEKQIYPDGVDYEQSVDYHRQVLEFLLAVIILCRKNHISVPAPVEQRVEKMLEFSKACTRPDGSTPMIGDADNGSFWSQGSTGHPACLAAGAVLFARPDFKTAAEAFPEAAFWLLGHEGLEAYKGLTLVNNKKHIESTAFEQAGFYVMRNKDVHLVLHCGKYGLHGHNDILGFDLFAHGQLFIADPGTYNYTGSYEWRNYFRSTFSHNTVRVDEQETHPLSLETIWFVEDENKYRVINWATSQEYDFFDAEHYCYHRLTGKVTHRRQVLFVRHEGYFIINDILTGSAAHQLEQVFNLAPVQVELSPAGVASCSNAQGASLLIIPDNKDQPEARLLDSWISYVYGAKQPTKKVVYTKKTSLPASFFTIIYPTQSKPCMSLEQIKARARQAWEKCRPDSAAE